MTKIDVDVLKEVLTKFEAPAVIHAITQSCLAAQAEKEKPDAKCIWCGTEFRFESASKTRNTANNRDCPSCYSANLESLARERFCKAHAPKPSFGLFFAVTGPESQEQLDSEFREWVKARGWNLGRIETSGFVGFDPGVGKSSSAVVVVEVPPDPVLAMAKELHARDTFSRNVPWEDMAEDNGYLVMARSVRRLLRDAELKGCRLWCDQLGGGPCQGEGCGSYTCRAIRKAILAAYPDVAITPDAGCEGAYKWSDAMLAKVDTPQPVERK